MHTLLPSFHHYVPLRHTHSRAEPQEDPPTDYEGPPEYQRCRRTRPSGCRTPQDSAPPRHCRSRRTGTLADRRTICHYRLFGRHWFKTEFRSLVNADFKPLYFIVQGQVKRVLLEIICHIRRLYLRICISDSILECILGSKPYLLAILIVSLKINTRDTSRRHMIHRFSTKNPVPDLNILRVRTETDAFSSRIFT